MLSIAIFIVVAAVLIAIAFRLVVSYCAAEGSPWQKLLAGAKNSATVLWSYLVAGGGLILVWASQAADFFALPEVKAFINQHLSPESVGVAMTVIAIITIVARLRTLGAG